jgi:hypothetical protein
MRTVGAVITLICGIAVLVGAFLPWLSTSLLGFTITISGMKVSEIADFFGKSIPEPYLVLIGGGVMIVAALIVLIVSLSVKGGRAATVPFGIIASLAATAALVGGIWFIIDVVNEESLDILGYGVYLSAGAALLGTIFGTIMTSKA